MIKISPYFKLIFSTTISITLLSACVSSDKNNNDSTPLPEAKRVTLLSDLSDHVILPQLSHALEASEALQSSINLYCNSVNDIELENNAKNAWTDAAKSWQQLELLKVGPAITSSPSIADILHVYSETNQLSTCGVDEAVAQNGLTNVDIDINLRAASQRGFDAIEYLLFDNETNPDLNHSCPSPIQTSTWNSLSLDNKKQYRCDYLTILSADLSSQLNHLKNAWSLEHEAYQAHFVATENHGESIEQLSNALFYIDKDLKDLKLGLSIGANCLTDSNELCPKANKNAFKYSQQDYQMIKANLEGFKLAFTSAEAYGFDDIITEALSSDESAEYLTQANNAIATAERLISNGSTLNQEAENLINNIPAQDSCLLAIHDPEQASDSACRLYGYVKRISTLLKLEFVQIVDVDIPDRAQSDND